MTRYPHAAVPSIMQFCGDYAISCVSDGLILTAVHPIGGIGVCEQLLISDAADKYILYLEPGFMKQPVNAFLGIPQVIMSPRIVHWIDKGKTNVQVPVFTEKQVLGSPAPPPDSRCIP